MICANLSRIKRDLGDSPVTLIAVSKTRSIEEIKAAFDWGVRDFGENYLQEAIPKIKALAHLPITWHYVGRLQSNKLKDIARNFDVIHSLDRLDHAQKLNVLAKNLSKELKVFIQVNLDSETQKGGVDPKELRCFSTELSRFQSLKCLGLMLIPKPASLEETFFKFKRLQSIRNSIPENAFGLSMGMSFDYKMAITAGATHIRLGSAVFGARQ